MRRLSHHQHPWTWISHVYRVITETQEISQKYKNETVNTVRSREADKLEQVEYLRFSVVRKLSGV